LRAGDDIVALVERGLDVEADPIDQRKDRGKTRGIASLGVQADPEAQGADFADGLGKGGMGRCLSAAEDDSLEKPLSGREKTDYPIPLPALALIERAEMGVVAVAALPRTPLAEEHGAENPGPVDAGEGDESRNREGLCVRRPHACRHTHRYHGGNNLRNFPRPVSRRSEGARRIPVSCPC